MESVLNTMLRSNIWILEKPTKDMKRRYEVKWYAFNLTERKSRKFFTEVGASLFAWWIEFSEGAFTKIYYAE